MPEQPTIPDETPEPAPDGAEEARGSRQRLLRAATGRPTRGHWIIGLVLAGVGFAAMVQVQSNERDDQYAGLRQGDLVRVFDGISSSTQRAEREIERLRAAQQDLQSDTSQRRAALEQAQQDRQVYGILAGVLGAQGPGVRITISDDAGEVRASLLLDTIQELRAAGAEAIEFNDKVRFVAQSSVGETAQGITIDGELIEAPYEIDVIGDPATLDDALVFPDGPAERVERVGGTLESVRSDEIVVDSIVTDTETDFAESSEDQ